MMRADSTIAQTFPSRKLAGVQVRWLPWRYLRLALLGVLLILLLPSDGYLGAARADFVIRRAVGARAFEFVGWEIEALVDKARDQVTQPGAGLTPDAQHDLVLRYFATVQRINQLTAEIRAVYANPLATDPDVSTAQRQAELKTLRDDQAARRPAVERILERQISQVLGEAGLTTLGQVLPPVRFQFSESPPSLIISPRDRILNERSVSLLPTLSLDEIVNIEDEVATNLDKSALVEGTGGISTYPTMVIDSTSVRWVLSTIAHEWGHTYLAFRPLGWQYFESGAMRTMNETTVSILGDEIGDLALARFYPELFPSPDWPRPFTMLPGWWEGEQQDEPFEFGPFMRQTRLRVDDLLADGRIEEAETYMETRRQILVEHGYLIRKLNQAYFAFHGSYAVGAAATDPIGTKLRALRNQKGSLIAFIRAVSPMTSVTELDEALREGSRIAAMQPGPPARVAAE